MCWPYSPLRSSIRRFSLESYALLQYAVQYELPQTVAPSSPEASSRTSKVVPSAPTAAPLILRVANHGRPLNVRSGPGLKYDVVSRLANRTVFRASGDAVDGWVKLTSGGWVSSRCTRKVNRRFRGNNIL